MRKIVAGYDMSRVKGPFYCFGRIKRPAADNEKCRLETERGQHIDNRGRQQRIGTVVEGKGYGVRFAGGATIHLPEKAASDIEYAPCKHYGMHEQQRRGDGSKVGKYKRQAAQRKSDYPASKGRYRHKVTSAMDFDEGENEPMAYDPAALFVTNWCASAAAAIGEPWHSDGSITVRGIASSGV